MLVLVEAGVQEIKTRSWETGYQHQERMTLTLKVHQIGDFHVMSVTVACGVCGACGLWSRWCPLSDAAAGLATPRRG